jgi:tetratricopeptide (TPR) repeat protein
MEKIHADYPKDEEAAVFYALALNGAADPADKTFSRQKKAGDMLAAMYSEKTNHPGLVHYIIHSYDSPLLAPLGLAAARKYASVAPSSAHAQHMPSHIFVRMGYWDEVIQSNTVAAESARCYAESTGLEGHWDEELHCLDYLIYAYLQKGDNTRAKQEWDYLKDMKKIEPVNFKVAYAFAAIPSRYVLENKMWKEAATLEINPIGFSWQQYPWQSAILYYTRGLGSAHAGNIAAAKTELGKLRSIQDTLARQKDAYKANLVQVQANTVEAWTLFKEGKTADALKLMTDAADLEDNTQKMAVTPSEVLPARELLGDMLLQLNEPAKALQEYEASLLQHANRFNGLYDAALAAERSGNKEKAKSYYQRLLSIADPKDQERTELKTARLYLNKI